jgi:hypothetical protein
MSEELYGSSDIVSNLMVAIIRLDTMSEELYSSSVIVSNLMVAI